MFWPVTDASFDTASYNEFAEGHFLTRSMMKWFWDNYTTDADERAGDLRVAAAGDDGAAQGLPPALVQTAGNDVLRDEGEAYARKLDAAGVDVIAVATTA